MILTRNLLSRGWATQFVAPTSFPMNSHIFGNKDIIGYPTLVQLPPWRPMTKWRHRSSSLPAFPRLPGLEGWPQARPLPRSVLFGICLRVVIVLNRPVWGWCFDLQFGDVWYLSQVLGDHLLTPNLGMTSDQVLKILLRSPRRGANHSDQQSAPQSYTLFLEIQRSTCHYTWFSMVQWLRPKIGNQWLIFQWLITLSRIKIRSLPHQGANRIHPGNRLPRGAGGGYSATRQTMGNHLTIN
jgi:hypothetical protein